MIELRKAKQIVLSRLDWIFAWMLCLVVGATSRTGGANVEGISVDPVHIHGDVPSLYNLGGL